MRDGALLLVVARVLVRTVIAALPAGNSPAAPCPFDAAFSFGETYDSALEAVKLRDYEMVVDRA